MHARHARLVPLLLALALPAHLAHGQLSVTRALDYYSFGSVWGAGAPTSYTTTTNWGKSYHLGKSVDGGSGFTWDLSASADASFNFASSARVSGGSMAATFHGTAETRVETPREIRAGDRITLETRVDGAQTKFTTTESEFGIRSVFSGSFDAEAKAKGCITLVGCESRTKSVDVSVSNRELVALNWNGDDQIRWGGAPVPGARFGRPVAVPGGMAAIMAEEPDIDGRSASGALKASSLFEDKALLHVAVDPVKAALGLARKGVPCLTDCSFKIPVIDKRFEWTLLDLDVYLDLGLRQSIDLVMHPFTAFDFSAPVRYRNAAGQWVTGTSARVDGWDSDFRFDFPTAENLTVSTFYGMVGTVTNRTYMTFTGSGHVEALEARLDGHGFGPLLDQSIPQVSTSVKLFDSSFDIDFGMLRGSDLFLAAAPPPPVPLPPPLPPTDDPTDDPPPQEDEPTPAPENQVPADPEPEVEVDATTTPEPATLALLATGVAALGIVARRRRG